MDDIRKYVTELPPEAETFFALADTTALLIGSSEKYWHSKGWNGARIRLLVEIAKAGGSILPSDLAARIGVTKANISVLLGPLERQSYIRSSGHPKDGRKRTVTLTEQGERLLRELLPGNRAVIAERMAALSEPELQQLNRLLAKLQAKPE
ncbi:MarR family winged helix-turn-helix transcriptional regulator [Paenibacillus flagellatus]|uniref:MarR family transcriptional regulator n=1 Tax=Paenibacillus flagellatus TaxID=2211139 RepID=A0A2V5K435_9BACL|nr:MarR family winged helix-turn-helix transcriptional regulator [Paenibacillus flagellatus]PYI52654.1 MarR family transcriptional regulator [Paenibacillus flagellatus]